tara:strand:+ start:288 stop:950 length:663 start_codon:yes stop_codon:yes gene_type:complete
MAYKQKPPTFFSSALKQSSGNYYYKVKGRKVNYKEYKDSWKDGETSLQTNDPDPFGIKAEHARNRAKLPKRPTVLTEAQTKLIEKKPPFKATRGYSMLMAGAGGKKYTKEGVPSGYGTGQYTSGDLSYRGNFDTDIMMEAAGSNNNNNNNRGKDNGNDNTSSSLDIKMPDFSGLNDKQKNYNTTSCPDFKPKKIDPKTGLTIQPGSRRRKRANRNYLKNL